MADINYGALLGRIKEKGFTQQDCAKAIGLTSSHFSRKLAGEFSFKQDEIEALCAMLDISSCDIGRFFFSTKC